mgnify:FL=1
MSLLPACTTEAQLQWARPYVVSLPGSDVVYAQGRVGASCPHPQEAEVQLWDYATGTLCGVLHHPGGILRDMQWMPIKCGPTTHAAGVLAVAHDANESCAQLWVVPAVPVGKETSSTASCCHWHWEQAALTLDHCRGASALSWREPHQWECSPPKQQHELLVGCADGRVHLCEVDCSAAGQLTFEPLLSIHPNTSPVSALCWARCGCISSYFMVYYAQVCVCVYVCVGPTACNLVHVHTQLLPLTLKWNHAHVPRFWRQGFSLTKNISTSLFFPPPAEHLFEHHGC